MELLHNPKGCRLAFDMEFHELANVLGDLLHGIAMFSVVWGFRCCHSCRKS